MFSSVQFSLDVNVDSRSKFVEGAFESEADHGDLVDAYRDPFTEEATVRHHIMRLGGALAPRESPSFTKRLTAKLSVASNGGGG